MLKVPFPLPDIEVERMVMTKRSMGECRALVFLLRRMSVGNKSTSISSDFILFIQLIMVPDWWRVNSLCLFLTGQPPPLSQWGGTTLTAEEIKDVVCSTAMWLVVRESFGGIGKVTRRGDGWRIRA
jgi:hypothetical protein